MTTIPRVVGEFYELDGALEVVSAYNRSCLLISYSPCNWMTVVGLPDVTIKKRDMANIFHY